MGIHDWRVVTAVAGWARTMHSAESNPLDFQTEFCGYLEYMEFSPRLCPKTSHSAESVRVPRLETAYE